MNVVRVLIADDHPFSSRGLREYLEAKPLENSLLVRVVNDVRQAEDALHWTRENLGGPDQPDIILTDVRMQPGLGGLFLCDQIKTINELRAAKHADWKAIKTIAWTSYADPTYLNALEKTRVSGFILKSAGEVSTVAAIRSVATTDRFVLQPEELAPLLFAPLPPRRQKARAADEARKAFERLTDAEKCVIRCTAEGCTNEEIRERLGGAVRANAVNKLRHTAYEKLGMAGMDSNVKSVHASYLLGLVDAFA